MEYLINSETLAAKERELLEKERALLAREQKYAERNKDFSPTTRLQMTLAAQVLGFVLLIMLGMISFSSWKADENIARGLDFIKNSLFYYFVISVAIPVIIAVYVYCCRKLSHKLVDLMLLTYVAADLVILLFLVHQQGGLCRSMFLPVFFLIPTAYMIVERREGKYRWRRIIVLTAIVLCIWRCHQVSRGLMPPGGSEGKPVEGIVYLFWWSKLSTDFPTRAHWDYDTALFWASIISACVPIFQLLIIKFRDRVKGEETNTNSLSEDYLSR